MNKPDKNFKLSKTAKRMLAAIKDRSLAGPWKKMMIDAEMEAKKAPPKSSKGSKNDNPTD
jgi:hypothetical protein